MKMKVLAFKKILALFIAIIILLTQLLVCGLNVLAESNDINKPPTTYPENCVKKLDLVLDYTGDFFGGNAFLTKKTFEVTNLEKYDTYEYDVYVESPNEETKIRTYFIDSTFNNSNTGRGFTDTIVKTNQWQHVTIKNWNTGYGMNGDKTDACGMLVEAMVKGDTRIVVKNVCVTSDDIVSPDKLPEKVISKVKGSVDVFVSVTTKENDLKVNFKPIDISYGDYIELDYYIGTPITASATISLVLKDENSKRAVYTFERVANQWQHLKLTIADFVMDESFDVTKVSSYSVEGESIGERLYFDNFCITGIAWPLEYPEGMVFELGEKFDISGTTGGKATVTPYAQTYDFSTHDFFEFDVYIESEDDSAKFYFFLYDDTYNGSSSTPSSSQRLQHNYVDIKTNEWVHIRTTISDIGKNGGKGNNTAISGFFVTALSKNNRYIIVNQCVTDLQIPDANNKYTVVSPLDKNIDYRGSNTSTEKVEIDPMVDVKLGDYLEFDASVVSEKESVDLKLVLEDENGSKATKKITIAANDWKHYTLKLSQLEGISTLGIVKNIYIEEVNNTSRICFYNFTVTKIVVPEMKNKFKVKENLFENWVWTGLEDIRYYFNDERTPIDLTQQEFLELDVLFETEVENPSFRMFFKDVNGKGGFYDFTVDNGTKNPGGWYHYTVNTSDFDTVRGGFNGDPTKAVWFSLHHPRTDNTVFHLVNGCFTYFEKPEQNNRYDVILDTGISSSWSGIFGSNCFKSKSYINDDKSPIDLTTGSHVELDIFVDSQEAERTMKIYFIDETFNNSNYGRGFWNVTVKSGQWNHILLDLSTVETRYEMGGDLTKTVGFMFEAMANDSSDIYTFHNIVLTKKATLPIQVGNLPYKPDKDSRYISDCESFMNDIGIWNTDGAIVKKEYKTEGSSSVMLKITDTDDNSNTLRFLFDDICNFTNSQSLRFDLFVDDMTLVKQNSFKVLFTSNRRFKDMAYEYHINSEDLVFGWNSFDIPLKDFVAQDNADWSRIYGFAIGVENTNLGADDYFYLGVDNIRVNKTFEILSDSNEELDDTIEDDDSSNDAMDIVPDEDTNANDEENIYFDDEYIENIEPSTDENNDSSEEFGGMVKKVIRRKKVNSGMSTDMIIIIVVVSVGGVLLISVLTLAILIEIKYRKIIKNQQIK